MSGFWAFYDWFERTCWGSLSRKLSSFLMLFFIDVAYLGIYVSQKGAVHEALAKSGANADALAVVDAKVHRVDWHAWPVWAWIGLFTLTAAMGAWMVRRAAAKAI